MTDGSSDYGYSYSDDYSYSGSGYSYTGDYSYSDDYSYTATNTEDTLAEAKPRPKQPRGGSGSASTPPKTPPPAIQGRTAQAPPAVPLRIAASPTKSPAAKRPPAPPTKDDDTGEDTYGYSESYSDKAGDSYSYDYSYSYSYSDSTEGDKQSAAAAAAAAGKGNAGGKGARQKPRVREEEGTSEYEYSSYSYSGSGPSDNSDGSYEVSITVDKRQPPSAKAKGAASGTNSYSYSSGYSYSTYDDYDYSSDYSYSDYSDSTGTATKRPPPVPQPLPERPMPVVPKKKKGSPAEKDSSYSYSSSYYSYSGEYSDSQSYSSDGYSYTGTYSSDSYSYPDYYYYSGDSGSYDGYYSSYSSSGEKRKTSPTSYSYSDTYDYSGSYEYSSYSSYEYPSYSSSTVRVDDATTTSTTSSYDYTSESSSLRSSSSAGGESAKAPREVLVLQTPSKDVPQPPPAPKRCFIPVGSPDDAVHIFLDTLEEVQILYETSRQPQPQPQETGPSTAPEGMAATDGAAATSDAFPAPGSEVVALSATEQRETAKEEASRRKKERKERTAESKRQKAAAKTALQEKKKTDRAAAKNSPVDAENGHVVERTPAGYFSARSVRMALRTLHLTHLERKEVLGGVPFPVPRETLAAVLNTCMATRVKERMAQSFLAHDAFRSGELPLTVVADILRRIGVARSPCIGGVRINVDVSGSGTAPEMVMTVETEPRTDGAEGTAATGEADAAAAWESRAIPVCRIVRDSVAAKQPTSVQWRGDAMFMGSHRICRGITVEAHFQRLKSYVEAATYLCVLAQLYTVEDDSKDGGRGARSASVLYPHVVRGLLLLTAPSESRKSIYMENLFRCLFLPMERLAAYAQAKELSLPFHGKDAVESTLRATVDTEEKRRRNVVPSTVADHSAFVAAPAAEGRAAGEVEFSFAIQKVRVADAVPTNARCFCLISAVTVDNVFLPAVEVPVVDIRPSSKKRKKDGGYTWTFVDKQHPKKDVAAVFAGPSTDRIYIECCYETEETVCSTAGDGRVATSPVPGDASAAVTEAHTHSTTTPPQSRAEVATTVWCAGYAVLPVTTTATTTVAVREGSLLDADDPQSSGALAVATSTAGAPATTGALTEEPGGGGGKRKKGLFACLAGLRRDKRRRTTSAKAASAATEVKVEVLKVDTKLMPKAHEMPRRFVMLWRHATVLPLLRAAILHTGKQCSHAPQALRHQAVRRAFSVAADAVLLDQLAILWRYKVAAFSKTECEDVLYHYHQIMLCASTLAAMNNLSSTERAQLADLVVKQKPMQAAFDKDAPMLPISV